MNRILCTIDGDKIEKIDNEFFINGVRIDMIKYKTKSQNVFWYLMGLFSVIIPVILCNLFL